jgi:valyl-tRNA synthetase
MLGDTAVAVNPKDDRYKKYKGQTVILPLMNREIPLIEDAVVDPEFGTGVVKVTPAHDPADFEMGQRHNLAQISVIGEDAKITSDGGPYQGLERHEARKRILQDLDKQGLLTRTESLKHNVGHCQRCRTVVEPLLSYAVVRSSQVARRRSLGCSGIRQDEFVPPNWANTYFQWMRTFATGVSRASSGGGIAFLRGTAMTAVKSLFRAQIPSAARNVLPAGSVKIRTFWIPGSVPHSGRFRL